MNYSLNLELTFRLSAPELPTIESEYHRLWQFASALQVAGFPIDGWFPPADNVKASLLNRAFDSSGPTTAAIAMARAERQAYPHVRSLGAWNGIEGNGGAAFTDQLSVNGLCVLSLQTKGVMSLAKCDVVADIVTEATHIWPALSVEVGSFRYSSEYRVFEKRPGAGWMLYLPRVLTAAQVPEARDLIPVMDGKRQRGTIIVSVIDEPFSATNKEHVAVANAIEKRLVDQDLLPLYTEL
ncbi:Imm52 family immunity protein (plasmid) [Paraburkholderia strydomiana]